MPATTATAEKIDLFKQHKDEYIKPKSPKLVDVGPVPYLVVRGSGAPGSKSFEIAIAALYGMAYTLKFQSKFAGRDYVVGKLEALYGVDGQTTADLGRLDTSNWNWRMMIRLPEFVTEEHLATARETLREKGKDGDFETVVRETIEEGQCVQMLHIGPYENEPQTVGEMLSFADEQGLSPHLWHHDIYLSDPRRAAPEKLRTIVRIPVKR